MTAAEREQVDRLVLELSRRGAGTEAVVRLTYGLPPRSNAAAAGTGLALVPGATGQPDTKPAAHEATDETNQQGDAA